MELELINSSMQNLMVQDEMTKKKNNNVVDKLPNEILRTILAKVKVVKLIRLRRVSKRWLVVIELICNEQRSLVIQANIDGQIMSIPKLSKTFNHLVDFGGVVLKVRQQPQLINPKFLCLNADLVAFLVRLFPNVENLAINSSIYPPTMESVITLLKNWSPTIVTLCFPDDYSELSAHVDNLTALRRLSFLRVFSLKHTTLARLEHISLNFDSLRDIATLLGPSLTSLHLDNSRVPQAMKPYKIAPLVQLSNLTQLTIVHLKLYLPALARTPNLLSLPSVRALSLFGVNFRNDNGAGEQFGQVFSTIFPNVEQLTIGFRNEYVRRTIAQHLDRFVHLRSHSFVSTNE